MDRLSLYADRLRQWQRRINLVGRGTMEDAWTRHFLDSAQLLDLVPQGRRGGLWLDFGSGAGFPGLVLAIMGAGHVHLVEADKRKAAFLRDVARRTAAPVTVHAARVEDLPPFPVDVVTARAVAPLAALLSMAAPFFAEATVGLFPKGRDVDTELTEAAKYWNMNADLIPSRTAKDARIVRVGAMSGRGRSAVSTPQGDSP